MSHQFNYIKGLEGFTLVQTHWNGMYYMLQSLTEQQWALGKFVSEYEMSENLMPTSGSS